MLISFIWLRFKELWYFLSILYGKTNWWFTLTICMIKQFPNRWDPIGLIVPLIRKSTILFISLIYLSIYDHLIDFSIVGWNIEVSFIMYRLLGWLTIFQCVVTVNRWWRSVGRLQGVLYVTIFFTLLERLWLYGAFGRCLSKIFVFLLGFLLLGRLLEVYLSGFAERRLYSLLARLLEE